MSEAVNVVFSGSATARVWRSIAAAPKAKKKAVPAKKPPCVEYVRIGRLRIPATPSRIGDWLCPAPSALSRS